MGQNWGSRPPCTPALPSTLNWLANQQTALLTHHATTHLTVPPSCEFGMIPCTLASTPPAVASGYHASTHLRLPQPLHKVVPIQAFRPPSLHHSTRH
eukprot:1161133-Pelagomonas_calceolata.AAC.8